MTDAEIALTRTIGQRLRAEREALGLSLAELSARTAGQYSKSRLSNYEQGLRRMSVEVARTLAHALGGVAPAYLLCLDEAGELHADERALLAHYRASAPPGRREILACAARIGGGARVEARG